MGRLSRKCKKLFPPSAPRRPGGAGRTGRHRNRLRFSPIPGFIKRFMWIVFFVFFSVKSTFHAAFHCGGGNVSEGCTLTCIWEPDSGMRNKKPHQTITPRQVNQPKRGRATRNAMKMSVPAEKLSRLPGGGAASLSLTAAQHERSGLAQHKVRRQELQSDWTTPPFWMFIVSPPRYVRVVSPQRSYFGLREIRLRNERYNERYGVHGRSWSDDRGSSNVGRDGSLSRRHHNGSREKMASKPERDGPRGNVCAIHVEKRHLQTDKVKGRAGTF